MTEVAAGDAQQQFETHVAILAPTGRDAALGAQILNRWGVAARGYPDMRSLCDAIRPGVGALVIAEEALQPEARDMLLAALDEQPSWSDVPLLVLTAEGELSRPIAKSIEIMARRGNVILLERPIRVATLVTAVRSALSARMRQFEIRDHLLERDRLLAAERTARDEAEQANRAKSEFLAVMSHELRTPLNAIAGYAELIELGIHGEVTPGQREALNRIQQSERHLLGLINGVLNYAQVERGAIGYSMDVVDVAELVGMAQALVLPQSRARGLTLECSVDEPGLCVSADPDKVQQIMLNLLSNAIKFTPEGGSVTIACEAGDRTVAIVVQDTGKGITGKDLERIFEPFVQVDSRLTRAQEGVGLGLAISRDLARGMGGDLTATSRVGKGSAFRLTLVRATAK